MSINKQTFAITSVLAYALATYVMVAPAFTVNQFNLPQWLAFLIVSIPFGGRVIGSFLYQRIVSVLGSRLTYLISMVLLGVLSLGSSINILGLLIPLRLLVGIVFGIATSLAVEQAVRSGNRIITALTMSGWAFGWIGGALSYLSLQDWGLIAISGILTIPFSLLYKDVKVFSVEVTKFSIPSVSSILVFFFSFEPAFALQLAPAIVEAEGGITWLIIGYIISIGMYILVPVISNTLGESKTAIMYTVISAVSGVLFFTTASPYMLVVFTAFGLGINSIAPRLSAAYGASARTMGFALNTAALGGVVVPVVGSLNIKVIASLFTAISMIILLVMSVKKGNAVTVAS
ncbi:transporter [Acidianus manzaensis]|uniref:Transporter n=2 Tax=Acidianus manzaensis TaxID=282676 RepID=A0A1W6K3G1_9CREN|nr:transporter [Acidianus manzaensis]